MMHIIDIYDNYYYFAVIVPMILGFKSTNFRLIDNKLSPGVVNVYVKVLSPLTSYYTTAAPMHKIHLRMRLSRGFLGKP